MTSLPVLGINYRKSVTVDRAFPAALQDTITGYAYLIRKGYKRIAVAGDSAGAGLALALMQYLAKMAGKDERPDEIVMPAAACFYSPWADLTFSHDYKETVYFDISKHEIARTCEAGESNTDELSSSVHPTMLRAAAAAYTCTVDRYAKAEDAEDEGSIAKMGRKHPYFSPALGEYTDLYTMSQLALKKVPDADSSVSSLARIRTTAEKLGQKNPK